MRERMLVLLRYVVQCQSRYPAGLTPAAVTADEGSGGGGGGNLRTSSANPFEEEEVTLERFTMGQLRRRNDCQMLSMGLGSERRGVALIMECDKSPKQHALRTQDDHQMRVKAED